MSSDFQKVGDSNEPMIGDKKLLVGGFTEKDLKVLSSKIEQSRLSGIPLRLVFVEEEDELLHDILKGVAPTDGTPLVQRFLLMSGFSDKELKVLLNGYKKWKLPKTLFATATPTNLNWTLGDLVDELLSEADAMC